MRAQRQVSLLRKTNRSLNVPSVTVGVVIGVADLIVPEADIGEVGRLGPLSRPLFVSLPTV